MTDAEQIVRAAIAKVACCPPDSFSLDADLFVELGVDSLGLIEIVVHLKRHLGTREPTTPNEYLELSTPQKLIHFGIANARSDL